jgi:signal transduction histidine kinase
MQIPIQLRLSLSFLFVLLLGIGLAVGLTWAAVERLYLDTQKENLITQAQLTAVVIEGSPPPVELTEPYVQTSNVMPGIHTRLLSQQGAVLVSPSVSAEDNPQQVPLAENIGFVSAESLLQRPEIQAALDGRTDTAVRRVLSVEGKRVLYAAAPAWGDNGKIAAIVYLATPLPNTGLPGKAILQIIGTVIMATALAGFTGTRLAKGIALPIEALDHAASDVAQGNLNQSVDTGYTTSELNRLSKSFNQMISSLNHSNQAKNAFITDVTHELRTPLTVIKGTIETLEDGAMDDLDGRDQLLTTMHAETNRLIRLVNDLLVLTRADASALNLVIQPLDLVELARSRCEYLHPLADERQISLEVITPNSQNSMWVTGDPDRLAQVLGNLLDNAIRHSPVGSAVKIVFQMVEDGVQCAVIDQGPGIPQQHLQHIFERFYRVDSSRNRKTGGAGLGLAIVKALVSAHAGWIKAESTTGKGCTFRLWLPASGVPPS